ncbi:hypothetical protein RHMOL_Rhmol13G0043600 [Rhododendron molle]|uniref:Uncharacterized protein n=1 Tax=Rhododendron molle TaxID=49168 RepID=A0ACC0L3D3_RHOML|nr:hypothetical protein RHMOL_Rhmol13G0043600 [Rhododendron molle]
MSSSLIINSSSSSSSSSIPFLHKAKLSIIDEFNDTKKPYPSAAKFPNPIIFCSLYRSSPITFSKSCSVRHLVSSVGNNIVDWDCGHDMEEEEEKEEEPKKSYNKVPRKSYKKAHITGALEIVKLVELSSVLCAALHLDECRRARGVGTADGTKIRYRNPRPAHGGFYCLVPIRGQTVIAVVARYRHGRQLEYKAYSIFVREYKDVFSLGDNLIWTVRDDLVKWLDALVHNSFVRYSTPGERKDKTKIPLSKGKKNWANSGRRYILAAKERLKKQEEVLRGSRRKTWGMGAKC